MSSRGLPIYGKVTLIKTLLISKCILAPSLLTVPKNITKELNRLIYRFLRKGPDKVTRVPAINYHERGGIKMIDLECMIESFRLAFLKRIFGDNEGARISTSYKRFERSAALQLQV